MAPETSTEDTMKISLPGAVFLVFLILKLTNHIAWSWWWVTAPLWGGFALWAVLSTVVLVFAAIVTLLSERR
jgi:hypothetical protein